MATYPIDPNAKLDYVMDWGTEWLAPSETIASYTVTAVNGVIDHHSELDGVITYWLKSAEHPARVTVHIVTSMGREDDRSDTFTVKQR